MILKLLMLAHRLIYCCLKTALYIYMDEFKCARHNDPVMQVKSLLSLFVERSICLAHYSHKAITKPEEAILVATTFNDYGR